MSLKFLAVGQSLVGIRGDKSPYALSKDKQLPSFDAQPRFKHTEKALVQTDWLSAAEPVPTTTLTLQAAPVAEPASAPVSTPPVQKAKRSWISFFRFKWFRTNKPRSEFVQSEMSLEKVQVMRNDLADSDLKLVLKRKKKTQPVFAPTQSNNRLERQGWSELTARLFELGQK